MGDRIKPIGGAVLTGSVIGYLLLHNVFNPAMPEPAFEPIVRGAVAKTMSHERSWILEILTRELDSIIELRNPGAHSETISSSELEVIRRTIIGVGREGLLGHMAHTRMRTG